MKFNISFTDGSTQTVDAADNRTDGEWIKFPDGQVTLLRVRAIEVASVAAENVAEREPATRKPVRSGPAC